MIDGCLVALLALPPLGASSAFAWGDRGHEIVGVIAHARLDAGVKQRVDALLADDADKLTAPDFVSRTTWADKYRDSDRNTTRSRYHATRNWHFINIDIATGRVDPMCVSHARLPPGTAASTGPANACLIDKINQFVAELHDRSIGKKEKILALKFLLHLIADLHQPLHVADNHDRGGNDIQVRFADGTQSDNLHSYWDNHLVERFDGGPKFVGASLNKAVTQAKAEAWSRGAPLDWAKDSFAQGKRVAYGFSGARQSNGDRGISVVRIDSAYDKRALATVREQLSKAGVRLAAVLQRAFG